ncbi:TPA: DUF2482 family protein, partial [Staphylococcus pseudintermedius]|nr:DUF2482 family protein [Staphylococcus pseudintermedius]HCA7421291.1 DUF2482 family protein [Staphylococcus pseudintermedius]
TEGYKMEIKNMTEKEVIKEIQNKAEQLFDFVKEVRQETEIKPCLITFAALDEGDEMNLFNQTLLGNSDLLALMLSTAENFEEVLIQASTIKIFESIKEE